MAFHFRQCDDPDCGFRFPAESASQEGRLCPKCGRTTSHTSPASHPRPGQTLRSIYGPRMANGPRMASGPRLSIVLDNLRSAYNVGSVFRTADGAGIEHLYLCGITPTPEHPGVAKTALGAEEVVGWSQHNNAVDITSQLGEIGGELWALENSGQATSLFDTRLIGNCEVVVLVVGNERAGVDPALRELCNREVAVPMTGKKGSLNVAVALGIAAYVIRFGTGRK